VKYIEIIIGVITWQEYLGRNIERIDFVRASSESNQLFHLADI
jgi:hypothetical protein